MKRTKSWSIALAATLIAIPGILAQAEEHEKLTVKESDQFGKYLADAEGRTLYMYTADTQAQAGTSAISNCYDTCADAWPPLVADKAMMEETAGAQDPTTFQTTTPRPGETERMVREGTDTAEGEIKKELISTAERRDGAIQLTYGGWPLYYFEKDTEAGQTLGQGVEDTGGEWYLVAPDGTMIEDEPQQ